MPRGKKTPRGKVLQSPGNASSTSGLDTSFMHFAGASAHRGAGQEGFTLQEEARNTERHHSYWEFDQKLRHTKVDFVSAGTLRPSQIDTLHSKDTESALAGMTLDSPPSEMPQIEVEVGRGSEEDSAPLASRHETLNPELRAQSPGFSEESEIKHSTFMVDTVGSTPIHTGLSSPQIRPPSPTPSNSSEEVILFGGRNSRGKVVSRTTKQAPSDPIGAKIKIVEDRIHKKEELLEEALNSITGSSAPPQESTDTSSGAFDALLPKRASARTKRRPHQRGGAMNQAQEDALVADYIANIENGKDSFLEKSFSRRVLSGPEEHSWQDETESEPLQQPSDRLLQSDWERLNLYDFDDLGTSDGAVGEVQAILSKRERQNGLQYLVVWHGQTFDEARWVPITTLISTDALLLIEEFEADAKLVSGFQDCGDEDPSDSEDIDIDQDEDEDDNQDLLQRKIDRMTDEQIARLLTKQEELGLRSDEILLFDETADADDDADEDVALPTARFNPIMLASNAPRLKGHSSKRSRGEFTAATALADAYDGFDVMDFKRPSLKKKPKGRKGKPIFDVSDSELESSMQRAWEHDRIKKKERKEEREDLRAQGLLGSKNGKPDLKQKYKEGMGIHAVKDEIKMFLMGSNTTLALPPMDKADRKVVHEIANAFKLKSKSAGVGSKRYPVLYRSSRTSTYVERTFDAVEARLTRRFLPRMDVGRRKSGAGAKRSGHGGGGGGSGISNAAVSYRDGDIVGGSAPELGVENKGRAMLEKMGWSTGTALGALNNKGILQPVSHVVKTTKAGLG